MNLVSLNNILNLKQNDVPDSLIFFIYHKNEKKNKYLKSVNKIQGFYYDSILKENIYLSSNGLKKNASLKKIELNKNILVKNTNMFVSYFSVIEDNLFKFNIYPKKYYKNSSFKFLTNQSLVQTTLDTKQRVFKKKNLTIFLKNSISLTTKKFNTFFGFIDKVIMIQSFWKKIFISTNRGICFNYSRKLNDRALFTGLANIYDEKTKESFKLMLMLNYLLIKFASNLVFAWKKNKNVLATMVIYFLYRALASYNFFSRHFGRRLRFRRNNYLLKRYNKSLRYRAGRLTRYFFKISLKKYKYHLKNNYWIIELFNINRKIFLTKNISQSILIVNKVNTLNRNEKINLLKYLLNYFKYKFSTTLVGYNEKYPLFAKIEFFKSLIFKNFYISNSFYGFTNLVDSSQNLLFNKAVALDNSLYSNEPNFVFTKRFKYDNSFVSNKIKIYTKTMNLFLAHPEMTGKNRRKKGKILISKQHKYIENYLNRFVPKSEQVTLSRLVRSLRWLRVRFNTKRVRRLNRQVFSYIKNIIKKTKLRSNIILIPRIVNKKKKKLQYKIK